MTNEEICVWLKAEAEPKFQRFTSGLIPGTDPIIGVRIPKLRTLAKKIAKEDWRGYLEHAACDTYEEIMLQGLVLGYAKERLMSFWNMCGHLSRRSMTGRSMTAFVQLLKLRRNTAKKSGIF